jgi:hypothetical protein
MEFLGGGVDGRNCSAGGIGQVSRLSSIGLRFAAVTSPMRHVGQRYWNLPRLRGSQAGTGTVYRLKRETDWGLPRQERGGALSVGLSITHWRSNCCRSSRSKIRSNQRRSLKTTPPRAAAVSQLDEMPSRSKYARNLGSRRLLIAIKQHGECRFGDSPSAMLRPISCSGHHSRMIR